MAAKVLETELRGGMRTGSCSPRAGSLGFSPPFLPPHGVPSPGTSLTCSRKRPQETEENKALTAASRLTKCHLCRSYYTFCARLLRAPLALMMGAAGASWAFGDFTSIYKVSENTEASEATSKNIPGWKLSGICDWGLLLPPPATRSL